MRYITPREWQGSREEFLWRIEQYLNWLTTRYGSINDWTAWALPAMFTHERMHTLHHEDAGRYDVVTYTAWQTTTGEHGDEDDYDGDDTGSSGSMSSGGNRNWNMAPSGEPEAEGEALPEACRPRPKANPAILRLAAAADHAWVQGNPSRTPSPVDTRNGEDLPEPECEIEDIRPDGRSAGERTLAAYDGFSIGGMPPRGEPVVSIVDSVLTFDGHTADVSGMTHGQFVDQVNRLRRLDARTDITSES